MRLPSKFIEVPRLYALLMAFVVTRYFFESISTTLARSIECLLLIWIVYEYLKCKPSAKYTDKYINTIAALLIAWNLFIMLRGNWNVSPKEIVFKVIGIQGVALYLLPLLLFLPYNSLTVNRLLKTFFYASLFAIPLWMINLDQLIQIGVSTSYRSEGIGGYLPFLAAFLLPLASLFSKNEKAMIRIIFVSYFLLMLINARRNIIFSFFLYTLIVCFIQFRYLNKKQSNLNVIFLILTVIIGFFLIINLDSLMQGPFNYLNKRMDLDTRSGVEELFLADFNNSPPTDWILGRGIDGEYAMKTQAADTGVVYYERTAVETGYLDLILKGGIIYDIIILMILIPAIYRGFKSKKLIKIVCGLFLFTYLIDLYTTSPLSTIGVRSILFWFCVSICYRKDILISKKFFKLSARREPQIA